MTNLFDNISNKQKEKIYNILKANNPRFAPTCSFELLKGLGKLGKKYQAGMQTHLVESRWEATESVRLNPECSCDTQIYEKAGLLENGPVIAAHFIFPAMKISDF